MPYFAAMLSLLTASFRTYVTRKGRAISKRNAVSLSLSLPRELRPRVVRVVADRSISACQRGFANTDKNFSNASRHSREFALVARPPVLIAHITSLRYRRPHGGELFTGGAGRGGIIVKRVGTRSFPPRDSETRELASRGKSSRSSPRAFVGG